MNVYLIGPMGAGKTTIGKMLAEKLQMFFYDSDFEIEQRSGATISWIFDVEGEGDFRRRELSIIKELTNKKNIVLATGGGTVLAQENRDFLKRTGTVIFLKASVDVQLMRVKNDKKRPLLQTENPEEQLRKLWIHRESLYRECSDYEFDTDHESLNKLIDFMIKSIVGN